MQQVGNNNNNENSLSRVFEKAFVSNKLEKAQMLLSYGASINDRPFLFTCVTLRWVPRAQFLCNAGADVNAPDVEGMTPLMHAASRGCSTVIRQIFNGNCGGICRRKGKAICITGNPSRRSPGDAKLRITLYFNNDFIIATINNAIRGKSQRQCRNLVILTHQYTIHDGTMAYRVC